MTEEWRSKWHSYFYADGKGVHVRYKERDGRLVVAEMYIVGSDEITPETLRSISVGRLEARAGTPRLEQLRQRAVPEPEPTLQELRAATELARAHVPAATPEPTSPRPRLTRPDGSNPDEFYRAVATAYSEYNKTTRAAAAAIAEEADVPVTSAHRWVREARRRGFLPPGIRGKTG